MTIVFNIFLAVLMTWFTSAIYPSIPHTGLRMILLFSGWNVVFWLFSFFYNKRAFHNLPRIGGLVLFYIKELIVASFQVTYDVLTPKDHMHPAIVAVPLKATTDLEITLLANFITLTPGTLSIDVSPDRKTLYIHGVYVKSGGLEQVRKDIKEGFEKKILKITRS